MSKETATETEYAEVVIDTPVRGLDRPFHYSVPERLRERVEVGSLVMVPFSSRTVLGYVVGFTGRPDVSRTREISGLLDEPPLFDFDTQRLCRWISRHYLCSLSQAFRLVLPPGRSRKVRQVVVLDERSPGTGRTLPLIEEPESEVLEALRAAGGELELGRLKAHLGGAVADEVRRLEEEGLLTRRYVISRPAAGKKSRLVARLREDVDGETLGSLPGRQREVAGYLLEKGGSMFQSDLLRATGAGSSTLKALRDKGIVKTSSEEVSRKPVTVSGLDSGGIPEPDDSQKKAVAGINAATGKRLHEVFLLEGVTGSGKTEVYIRCIADVLERGGTAIVLVPEIALTPQTVERFESRFPGEVAVLHSALGVGERFDEWRSIRDGRYRVVVGARSALFAPLRGLRLIVIDEEHEPSYKSDKAPRYHAREVAIAKARMAGAAVVLGSATPSLESLKKAESGAYRHLVLPRRIDNRPMPDIEVVDMRTAGGAGTVPLLSTPLLDALSRTVESGNQAILFLNRRGFANYLQCPSCGFVPGCEQCEVSLCYHIKGDLLACHHCGSRRGVPPSCPECGLAPLKRFGAGTQRVEEELSLRLPGVSTTRMDADTTSKRDSHRRILTAFRAGEASVLIGTQMVAKGLDIPGVTLVGIINADTALALPDFRAAERTYQLITQVSGRAGRGLRPGRVIIQTFRPEHPAIRAASGDTGPFLAAEFETRLNAGYPPFLDLVNILVTSREPVAASRAAARLKSMLLNDLRGTGSRILGPAPAPLSRLKGTYRWHILVKVPGMDEIAAALDGSVGRFYRQHGPAGEDVRVSLDVDPVSLL